uniref:E4 n=1 Tax=human papillomavirus 81 TaxID=333771 RepID=A0A159DZA9_9PAPI|nr:E4 [human papillomavirus 81]ALT55046.1 E4 [human papillomavirus 81]
MNHATLYLAPRTPCEKYPLLKLLTDCCTPPNPPPVPSTWAPPRPPRPQCRRRLASDSESTGTECGSPTLHHRTSGWTITNQGPTVTLTAQKHGTSVTVTLHL